MNKAKKREPSKFESLIRYSHILIMDSFDQLIGLVESLKLSLEIIKNRKQTSSKKDKKIQERYIVTMRAYKSSIITFQFCILELICDFLIQLVIKTNEGLKGIPKKSSLLTKAELEFITEKTTQFNSKTKKENTRQSFIGILDKLTIPPYLLGKLYDKEFNIDKGGRGWNGIKKLKKIRDELTHPKLELDVYPDNIYEIEKIEKTATNKPIKGYENSYDYGKFLNIFKIRPTLTIKNTDLLDGAESIRWYIHELARLFKAIYTTPLNAELQNPLGGLTFIEIMCFVVIDHLRLICNISESKHEKKYPLPYLFQSFDPKKASIHKKKPSITSTKTV